MDLNGEDGITNDISSDPIKQPCHLENAQLGHILFWVNCK